MTLLEQGKRLIGLLQYARILERSDSGGSSPQHSSCMVTDLDPECVWAVQNSPTTYCLMPGPEFSSILYRGQNEHHSVCIPSIFRLPRNIDCLFWQAKIVELSELLIKHPACAALDAYQIEGLAFTHDFGALAQHYGYPTTLVDFSRSKEVAMFFACCVYDPATDTYSPQESGTAVLYTADLKELLLQPATRLDVKPLGLHPLPRPHAQKAFALRMARGSNLDCIPGVSFEQIEITPQLSRQYYEMFDGGRMLFPSNPFDDLIRDFRESRWVSRYSLELGMREGWLPSHPEGIIDLAIAELEYAGYGVSSRPVLVAQEIIDSAEAEWQSKGPKYFSKIRLRGTCDHLILDNDGNSIAHPGETLPRF